MHTSDYSILEDGHLADLLYIKEDRLPREAAEEIARRTAMAGILSQVVMDKQSWLTDLPEWWAVVHATYMLGFKGGEEVVQPLLTALRWADAFDCDWVCEVLPAIFGRLGPPAIPGLTAVTRDTTAGWSVRDIAMKGLAAISHGFPDSATHVFSVIGQRFMDEGEDRLVRQLAGQILLDFRCLNYRLALSQFAREELALGDLSEWYPPGFSPDDVEWAFHHPEPDIWHYTEDWMRFYEPSEIQRRQKRWDHERLSHGHSFRERISPAGGGRVVSIRPQGTTPDKPKAPEDTGPQDSADK